MRGVYVLLVLAAVCFGGCVATELILHVVNGGAVLVVLFLYLAYMRWLNINFPMPVRDGEEEL